MENKRAQNDRRQAETRRLNEIVERRANERAAELSALPACMTRAEEEAEEAWIDRMHEAQNRDWRARGWIPWPE